MRNFELFRVPFLPFEGKNMVDINRRIDRRPAAGVDSWLRDFIKEITYLFYRQLFARGVEITGKDLNGRSNILKIRRRITDTKIQQVTSLFGTNCGVFLPVEMCYHDYRCRIKPRNLDLHQQGNALFGIARWQLNHL
ncbi:MAG: hypothetical protein XXXJIFNMEKO3_LKCDNKCA_00054 (plasmid) [Candidatus Erwinia impunctatus]